MQFRVTWRENLQQMVVYIGLAYDIVCEGIVLIKSIDV